MSAPVHVAEQPELASGTRNNPHLMPTAAH